MKYCLTVIALIAILAARPREVNADLMVAAEDVTVLPGASSFFDVFAIATPPIQNASGWQFQINLDPTAAGQITITGIGAPSAPHPNIFPGVNPFAVLPITPSMVSVTNFPPAVGAFESLDDQDGFVRVFFDALPGALPGTYDITIDPLSAEIVDDTLPVPQPLAFDIADGSIVLVPEASSLFLCWTIVGVLGLYDVCSPHRRRRAG